MNSPQARKQAGRATLSLLAKDGRFPSNLTGTVSLAFADLTANGHSSPSDMSFIISKRVSEVCGQSSRQRMNEQKEVIRSARSSSCFLDFLMGTVILKAYLRTAGILQVMGHDFGTQHLEHISGLLLNGVCLICLPVDNSSVKAQLTGGKLVLKSTARDRHISFIPTDRKSHPSAGLRDWRQDFLHSSHPCDEAFPEGGEFAA